MTIEVLYLSVRDDVTTAWLGETLQRISASLAGAVGGSLPAFRPIDPPTCDACLTPERFNEIDEVASCFTEALFRIHSHARCLILVDNDHSIARLCRQNNKHALWGSVLGCSGFVYGNVDERVILHECLHLLGATDCYAFDEADSLNDLTCRHSNCLMQHDPTRVDLARQDVVCRGNVNRCPGSRVASPGNGADWTSRGNGCVRAWGHR